MKTKHGKGSPTSKYSSKKPFLEKHESKFEKIQKHGKPMDPFRGTKWFNNKSLKDAKIDDNHANEGIIDFTSDTESKVTNYKSYDFSKLMSKLEQFSDVWNDCPTQTSFNSVNGEHESYRNTDLQQNTKNDRYSIPTLEKFEASSSRNLKEKQRKSDLQLQLSTDTPKIFNGLNSTGIPQYDSPITLKKTDPKLADFKRKKAVEEHRQMYDGQKSIIQQALSSLDKKSRPNKKIVFSDTEENKEEEICEDSTTKRAKLFIDDDDEDGGIGITDLKINNQFKGKKGQKLLELQTKFASDSRFKLDTRFYESGSEESESEVNEKTHLEDEKKKNLAILESIVKHPIKPLSEVKNLQSKKSLEDTVLLRFDPTREDHKKYVVEPEDASKPKESESHTKKKKSKEKNNNRSLEKAEESSNKTQVSNEKFFAVKETLKEVLKKDAGTEKFSLLKLFGSKDSPEPNTKPKEDKVQSLKKLKHATKNPFKYDSSESESEEISKDTKEKNLKTQSTVSWVTPFFFIDNDPRIQEAQEFLNGPAESEDNQSFAEKRKLLKDFIRHKFKTANRKKSLFKKKLGGLKKKSFQKKKARPK